MAAVDDLSELVERAAAVEKSALASKWKEESDVQGLIRRMRKAAEEQRQAVSLDTDPERLSPRWAGLRQNYLDLGAQPALPGQEPSPQDSPDDAAARQLSHQGAAQAEQDAVAAVGIARIALTDAALAVLQARLARIQAGEGEPESAAIDGHVPLHGRNPVSRHGPALAHGVTGEINYILTRKPRNTVKALAIALALGLLYLGYLRVFQWDRNQQWLPYLGLWVVSVVMGGSVCINAMSFDAMRVRAALDTGARLWHLLVIKNLALLCIVAPIGFLLSALLAWRAGDLGAFVKACALVICFILLWLGVGNVLSIWLPTRDEPIRKRRQSGSLKQFLIAFAASYAIGYLVNFMLVWRVLAARALTERMGQAFIPGVLIVLSCLSMWMLLTVFAVALAQQPKVRRTLQKEIADYQANAEAGALAAERAAASTVATKQSTPT
ncbi:MAG: hypothetical protein QOH17_4153 [Pseudonocardiales bacterium]|nr:hypothetical protein [Pseudonocardiales bacterium]